MVSRDDLKDLSEDFQKRSEEWDKKSDTLLKNANDLVDKTKYRYSVRKGKTAYTSANPIDECFEPLLQDLRTIETKMAALKTNCRVRGYVMLGGFGAVIGGATAGIMSGVSDPDGLNLGVGVYSGVMTLLTVGVGYGLYRFIDSELGKLVKEREALIRKASRRVAPFAIELSPTYTELEALSDEQVQENHTYLKNMLNMLKDELEQEEQILFLLQKIIDPLNANDLKATVFLEMLFGWLIIVGLALTGRFTRGTHPIPKPK